ncbi:MogA/MoaB family molybdenum cofactor biosynthesis protein [Methanobacterium sp. YSL]|jgi:molybdenum cofactor biosynthesis protein B|nr:MogA/MoaB family molybdenum cofactor biosynthesis protein [Methanobacterium sp. YSL]
MKSKTMEEHKKHSPLRVKIGIITLSDSKSNLSQEKNPNFASNPEDLSGKMIIESLEELHEIVSYQVIPDDAHLLLETLGKMKNLGAEIIISTGGTGIGKRDITIETIKPLFEKELNGFGEVFRYETYKELGTGAIMTRATAGVWNETLLVALPGSPNAVQLGVKLIKPEMGHIVKHMKQ